MSLRQRAIFPAALAVALLLGLFLHWPSLASGYRTDDYVQVAMLRGQFPAPRSRFDLFDFASGKADEYRRLLDFGHLPWWTTPTLRLRMLRPLSSALIAFDFDHFVQQPGLAHAHSLLWFVLLLMAAGWLLSRTLPPVTAGLAVLMFAVSPCHVVPIAWLANRSTLVAGALGFLAVDLQMRYRERPWLGTFLLTGLVTSLALLAGEYALAALAYAFAYVLSEGRSWRERLRVGMPVLLPVCAYLLLHSLLGSDIIASGFYLSPMHDPWGFTRALFTRAPVLAADVLFELPSIYFNAKPPLRDTLLSLDVISPEVWVRLPDWRIWHVLIGYVAIAAAAWLIRRLTRDTDRRHPLRWLSAGAALALLPGAASLPEDRLLVAATLGASALIASALVSSAALLAKPATLPVRVGRTLLGLALLSLPLRAAQRSFHNARGMREGAASMRAWSLDADLPKDPATRVYVLAAGDFNTAVNLPWLRLFHGRALPRSYRRLCPGSLPFDLTRKSERVLEVYVLTNALRGTAVPSLYRADDAPMHVGDHVSMPGFRVDVLEVLDDNPSRMRFTFDRSVDDPALWFLIATESGLRHQPMPAIGETRRVPFAQFRDLR